LGILAQTPGGDYHKGLLRRNKEREREVKRAIERSGEKDWIYDGTAPRPI